MPSVLITPTSSVGATSSLLVRLTGESPGDIFGFSVGAAGDVNGDGYDDVIVGAPTVSKAYLFFGGSPPDDVPDVVLSIVGGRFFGGSVSGAGDVNGDGYDDVLIASDFASDAAYLYLGGPTFSPLPFLTLTGEQSELGFGISLSGAGDINGDGYGDFLVGSPPRVYVFFGGPILNADADLTLMGEMGLGTSVSGAGDLNGDGYADVLAGGNGAGRVLGFLGGESPDAVPDLFFGADSLGLTTGWSVSAAGDMNGDGYDDVIVGTSELILGSERVLVYYGGPTPDSTPDVSLADDGLYNFGYAVAGIGDVNRDGYSDVAVGVPLAAGHGQVLVFYGGPDADRFVDLKMDGEPTGAFFGWPVSRAGDVDGDGHPELVAGDRTYPGDYMGRAYVLSFRPSALPATVELDPNVLELSSRGRWVTTYIEPVGFDPTSIDVSSIRIAGTVPAEAKFGTVGDHDGDDVPDLIVKFRRAALAPLLILGVNQIEVTGTLVTGESFAGTGEVTVMDSGTNTLSLQLLSPSGAAPVQFAIRHPGTASHHVAVYDVQGRLLRKWSGPVSGTDPIFWDGRGDAGQVGSGIYFIRVVEGVREATLKVVLAR